MSKFWFAGGYYIDMDEYGQFRIAGPGNHLFCGWTLPKPFTISQIKQDKNRLKLNLTIPLSSFHLHYPAMGDIRSVRSVTEVINRPRPTFEEMQKNYPGQFMPTETVVKGTDSIKIIFNRRFSGYRYGFDVKFVTPCTVVRQPNGFDVTSDKPEVVMAIACTFDFPLQKVIVRHMMLNGLIRNSFSLLPGELQNLVERSEEELGHMLSFGKTSGYEYGTIFPRDWMEAAELGVGDLSPSMVEEMYDQALKNVSVEGVGWHEDVIGEAAHRFEEQGIEIIDRRMIDIEPRYLLGLGKFSPRFFQRNDNLEKLRRVSRYILSQARSLRYITFKDPLVGNWRDSPKAFLGASGKIAPYDVNVVFYPAALEKMSQFRSLLHLEKEDITPLEERWKRVRESYAFYDQRGEHGYSLCLYGDNFVKLPVHHTDEAYDMMYGWPSRDDCLSFAKRLIDPDYFYSPSGPLVVGKRQGYETTQYHGEVIWPKQTALVVAGLRRQLDRSFYEDWSFIDRNVIKLALIETARSSLKSYVELDSVPELYFDKQGKPERYDTQHARDGQVSYIQLWSAIGFRRILRDLLYVSLKYDQPMIFFNE